MTPSEGTSSAVAQEFYPDAAHGFLFPHAAEFAGDVEVFLSA